MRRSLAGSIALALLGCVPALAGSPPPPDPPDVVINDPCYPGSALDLVPVLNLPPEESWNHPAKQKLITAQGAPYHMVHDQVVPEGADATIVGKFDYGALFHKDLEDEKVIVYIYGDGRNDWEMVGVYTTDSDGKIFVTIENPPVGHHMLKMVVAGDLTEAYGYLTVVPASGRKAVLFDIDGTLTEDDMEITGDYLNVTTAKDYAYAKELVTLYKARGYEILYLTARPYWVAKDTREWFVAKEFPSEILRHTSSNGEAINDKVAYKAGFIQQVEAAGLDVVRVYGNASTDIEAYEMAGIPKSETFIIGPNAGDAGTQPLNPDYEAHYNSLKDTIGCAD